MIPSHAVHGDWVDLLKNHLVPDGDVFEPNFERKHTDGWLLSPVGLFVIEAVREYLNKYFDHPDTTPFHKRLASLQERLLRVQFSRNDWQLTE